ncbi:M48 family metalloprotease [soil metagenome]
MRFALPLSLLLSACLCWTPVGLRAQSRVQTPAPNNLPNLGSPSDDEFTPSAERKIGAQIWGEIQQYRDALDDREITEYLNLIGNQLAIVAVSPGGSGSASPFPASEFTFFAVKDPTINAFALPGAYIGVNTGLLTAAQTESELASVLGHEIGHVTQRHIAAQISQGKGVNMAVLGAVLLGVLAATRGGNSAANVAQATMSFGIAGAISAQLAFSRDAEREADRIGFQTLTAAGYEPLGMATFFQRLQQASRYYEGTGPAFATTHPLTIDRISDIQNRVRESRYRQHVDRFDFLLARARATALSDTTAAGLRNSVTGFKAATADAMRGYNPQASANFYGLAVALLALRDFAAADAALQDARSLGPEHGYLEKLQAEIRVAQNRAPEAVDIMKAALARWPSSLTLIDYYSRALQAAGHNDQAAQFLRERTVGFRSDPGLYELLARSYESLGQPARQHQALGEAYRLRGSLKGAVEQYSIAQRLMQGSGTSNDDYVLSSEIASRLRELREQLKLETEDRKKS